MLGTRHANLDKAKPARHRQCDLYRFSSWFTSRHLRSSLVLRTVRSRPLFRKQAGIRLASGPSIALIARLAMRMRRSAPSATRLTRNNNWAPQFDRGSHPTRPPAMHTWIGPGGQEIAERGPIQHAAFPSDLCALLCGQGDNSPTPRPPPGLRMPPGKSSDRWGSRRRAPIPSCA